MDPPGFLLSNPPSLSEQLRQQTNELRCRIARDNCNTQFAQAAAELTEFRRQTANLLGATDDDALSDIFRKTVRFTTYEAYAPFIEKLLEQPCKASTMANLLAPGLPDFLVISSSTSGGISKIIPKYNRLSKIRELDVGSWVTDPLRRRTAAHVRYLWYDQMEVEDEGNHHVKSVYLTCGSALNRRMELGLDPEKDKEKMGIFILDHAAPYAAGFIKKWPSFLLIHALFAVSSRSLETMSMLFVNTFVDMMRHLDMEFDMVVDSVENGTIPNLDGLEEVLHYLEPNLAPDPERAAELRSLGRPSASQGWCSHAWPNLRSVSATASGSFASSLSLAQWFLGSGTNIYAGSYGCSESSVVGSPYNPRELNQFKLRNMNVIEFLDISKNDDSINDIAQAWEVEAGRQYEVVLTTPEGLWRYRLGDVVEIAGFDPTDGVPVVQFIERRNMAIRFPSVMVTETELRSAMSSVPQNMLPNVVDWTATIDDRQALATIGFFVELASDQVSGLALGTSDHVSDALLRSNTQFAEVLAQKIIRKPTIRLVSSGTFSDFRQLKLTESSSCLSLGQVKVPVVVLKAAYIAWFSTRVVREL